MKKYLRAALAILMAVGMVLSCVACKKPEEPQKPSYMDDGKTYTYRMGPSDIPDNWNIHTYTSSSSTYVLNYTEDSLYTFDYNANFDGYAIVPSMAKDFPVDVTADFVGKYGIEEGDEDRVYKITIKDNLTFDNGEKITAQSFVDSMKLLLNPAAANFRADSFYASGDLKIYNSENYVKQGSSTIEDCTGGAGAAPYQGIEWDYVVAGQDGTQVPAEIADNVFFYPDECYVGAWSIENYSSYVDKYGMLGFWPMLLGVGAPEDMVGKSLTEILANEEYSEALYGLLDAWCTDPNEPWGFFCYKNVWPEIDFSEVGFFSDGDYDLYVVLKNAMDDNFYLRYELCTSFFLVYTPLYEQCASVTDGVYTSTYGTSVDTYVGFGPYKLTSYTEGAEIILSRNEGWHGYQAGEYVENTYMCDNILYKKVSENSTRLEMFLKGELDSYGLQAADMDDYYSSPYTYFSDSESTWYLAMNPDYSNLKAKEEIATPVTAGNIVNKTVLAIDDFRWAMSYSLNRTDYNKTLDPMCGVAPAYLSSAIIADPDTGMSYRSTDEAKDAILNFWGLSDDWGEGKEYATRDDAIASITGYDPTAAKELFTSAYNTAVEMDYIDATALANGNWEVQIAIGLPSSSNIYIQGYEYLSSNWTKAVEGTPFEGHLSFVQAGNLPSSGWGEYLRNGSLDLFFFVGYSGSQFNPYSMLECLTGSLRYDAFTDYSQSKYSLDIELNGKNYRASIYDWLSNCLQGNEIQASVLGADGEPTGETEALTLGSSAPSADRIHVLAACESYLLNIAHVFPTSTDATASLRCMRYIYKTEEDLLGVGHGGLKWCTFAMDDTEWEEYVASEGGILNYK